MNRRGFLHTSAALGAAGLLPARAAEPLTRARYCRCDLTGPPQPPRRGVRPPLDWEALELGPEPVRCQPRDVPAGVAGARLRFAVAYDERDDKLIEVRAGAGAALLGTFELRNVSAYQVYELPLTPAQVDQLRGAPATLHLVKGTPAAVLLSGPDLPPALAPHLLVPGNADPLDEFFDRFGSLASLQPWSWNEGCVLDGLLDLARLPAHSGLTAIARQHIGRFVRDGKLRYEAPGSFASADRIYGIEGALPFAALAKLEPRHPLLDLLPPFAAARRDPEGCVIDGHTTTSEGAYTVGYPLAVLANVRHDDALARLALDQVSVRQRRLFDGRQFWRTSAPGPKRGNRHWARGIAWQFLGSARTLRELAARPETAALVPEFQRLANWIVPFQRPDGLFSVFVDEPALTPDAAGSAGIAAALAIGAQQGWLTADHRAAAARALTGLRGQLTPDGFLGGVSQSNKGGESLQRSTYRVIYQMGMGLLAQLIAALG